MYCAEKCSSVLLFALCVIRYIIYFTFFCGIIMCSSYGVLENATQNSTRILFIFVGARVRIVFSGRTCSLFVGFC